MLERSDVSKFMAGQNLIGKPYLSHLRCFQEHLPTCGHPRPKEMQGLASAVEGLHRQSVTVVLQPPVLGRLLEVG